MDTVAISVYAKGLTPGEIPAHFAQVYGASISKDTVSRITDRVVEEMRVWCFDRCRACTRRSPSNVRAVLTARITDDHDKEAHTALIAGAINA